MTKQSYDARNIINAICAKGISRGKLANMLNYDNRGFRRIANGENPASEKMFAALKEIHAKLEADAQVRSEDLKHLGQMIMAKIADFKATIDPKITLDSFAMTYLKLPGSAIKGVEKGRVLEHSTIKKIIDAGCWTESERATVARLAIDMLTTTAKTMSNGEESAPAELLASVSYLERKLHISDVKDGAYFLVAACKGALVPESMILSTKFAAMRKGAQVFVQAVKAHDKPLAETDYPLDQKLHEHFGDRMFQSIQFGNHLWASDFKLTPQTEAVIGKMKKISARKGMSIVVPHPTQQLETTAAGLSTNCRVVLSTGVISLPDYQENYAGINGEINHKLGGVFIEIISGIFHARHFEYAPDGSLVLDGIRYSPRGNEQKLKCKYLNVGDSHGGPDVEGDELATMAIFRAIKHFAPEAIGLNDLFEGKTISHHRENDIEAEQEAIETVFTLKEELRRTREYLMTVKYFARQANKKAKILAIGSNHNTHLHKYLKEKRWVHDKFNFLTANELAYQFFNKKADPLQFALDPDKQIAVWPDLHDEIVIEGVEVNNHGHLGVNGARGSLRSDELAFRKSTGGHSHSVSKKNDTTRAGTTSKLRMGYNQGPSSWAHGFEAIFEGGFRTLYIVFRGEFMGGVADLEAGSWKEIKEEALGTSSSSPDLKAVA